MKTSIIKSLSILMLSLSAASISSLAMAEAPKIGTEFEAVAQPIATDNAAKIEVMEIFGTAVITVTKWMRH